MISEYELQEQTRHAAEVMLANLFGPLGIHYDVPLYTVAVVELLKEAGFTVNEGIIHDLARCGLVPTPELVDEKLEWHCEHIWSVVWALDLRRAWAMEGPHEFRRSKYQKMRELAERIGETPRGWEISDQWAIVDVIRMLQGANDAEQREGLGEMLLFKLHRMDVATGAIPPIDYERHFERTNEQN